MASNTVSGGGVLTKTKRVFLASGTAYTGYAVCYNYDAVGVTAENDTLSTLTAITDWCDARRVQVEVPNIKNNANFAGVVDEASNGVVGPNWILIHEPGSICEVATSAVISIGTPGTAPCPILNFTVGNNSVTDYTDQNGKFWLQGLPGAGAAQILEENDGSDGRVMAQLLTGPQSGGVQVVGTAVTISALCVSSDAPLIKQGVVCLTALNLDAADPAAAPISLALSTPTAFPGQRLIIKGAGATTATDVVISAYGLKYPQQSVGTTLEVSFVALATVVQGDTGFFYDIEYNGSFWFVNSYYASSALLS